VVNKNRSLLTAIVVSISLHVIILIYLGDYSVRSAQVVVAKSPEPLIQARLVLNNMPMIPPEDTVPIVQKARLTPAPEKYVADSTEPQRPLPKQLPNQGDLSLQEQPAPDALPFVASPEAKTHLTTKPRLWPNHQVKASGFDNLAQRQLAGYQQQKTAEMAQQSAQDHQQKRLAALIDTSAQPTFLTVDEQLRKSRSIRADCSTTTKQAISTVIGFLGGNINCTQGPQLNDFINQRLDKNQGSQR
jgi:hypothetical protein